MKAKNAVHHGRSKRGTTLKLVIVTSILTVASVSIGCSSGSGTETRGPQRVFRAINASTSRWYDVPSTLLVTGTHCLVYGENSADVTLATAKAVAGEYDADIYTAIIDKFGESDDVDGNGKTILLLMDIQDGYDGTGAYIGGYFDPTNMFNTDTEPNSNEADMLFLDINPSVPGSSEFYATIAHEFQHLINFSRTYLLNGIEQDVWINEGLSSGAEYVYSGAVSQERVDWFNEDSVGTIAYGNNFFVWDGYWEKNYPDSVLDNYATVSLFFQWLRLHATNGTGIYKAILDASFRDYRDVTTAAAAQIDGSFGSWETLLQTWHVANVLCRSDNLYGYKGAISVAMPGWASSNNTKASIAPGEAIASLMPAGGQNIPTSGSGASIRYVGIASTGTGTLDTVSPYTGAVSLVFNANADIGGPDETGYVASVAGGAKPSILRSVAAVKPIPKSWKVDLRIGVDGSISELSRRQLDKNSRTLRPMADTVKGKR